jgi:hypothetical protein
VVLPDVLDERDDDEEPDRHLGDDKSLNHGPYFAI